MDEKNPITYFAETDFRNKKEKFGIKASDRTRHVYTIGKTGMGKSTLLENMAVQDIQNGNGIAFIDPHGGTAEKLLDYIPEHRIKDVVYFAPFDMEHPISFNVMEDVGYDKRHLVVSGLMSAFEKIWADAWSARMAYILSNTLFALLEYPGSTLLDINKMLVNKEFRKKVVENVTDPSIKSFWVDEFAKYSDRYAQEATPAIQNKVGQFVSNPLIRDIIGQPKSSFDIRDIMDNKKIFIMNLSKGRIGESNTNLLGSMLITKIYLAAMSRADLSNHELAAKPNFYFFVDEFQSFANKSFADILSEARKYKLNLTIAHQYIEQMEEEVRSAVFGNVGTMIVFRVGSFDADIFEKEFAPTFMAEDIVNLGFAQIYLKLMIDGVSSKPFSAMTLPPIALPPVSSRDKVIESSRRLYARPRTEVEKLIKERMNEEGAPQEREGKERKNTTRSSASAAGVGNIGKREGGYERPVAAERHAVADRRHIPDPRRHLPPQEHAPEFTKPIIKEQAPPSVPLETLKTDRRQEYVPRRAPTFSENKNQLREALADILKEQKVRQQEEEKKEKKEGSAPPPTPTPSIVHTKEENDMQNGSVKEVPEEALKKMLE
ncbi:MAG: type IV secretion system DNA-binding domain-containing protein [Patescibacteria group bacterium]|nr:type IV secretion system DNA-binding domain-containing protein [Patescibacteria group bacterium]